MKYRNHFLTNVIFRIDFVQQIESMRTSLDEQIVKLCLQKFPLLEEYDIREQQVQVNKVGTGEPQTSFSDTLKFKEWHFSGRSKEKSLTISSNALTLESKQYSSFDLFCGDYRDVLSKLMEIYSEIRFKRIGLRYIDQIDMPYESKRKVNWKTYWNKYIAAELVGNLSFQPAGRNISRCLSSIEVNSDGYMVRFQYGMFNPDYPAVNKKNNFVLDTDVYTQGDMSMKELASFLEEAHGVINVWFENSIKQPLRDYMGVMNSGE